MLHADRWWEAGAQCAHLFSIKSASSHPLKKLLASQICFSPAPAVAAEPASASEKPGGGCAARFPLRSRDVSSVEARTSACARPHGSAHAREASASGVLGEGRAGGRAGGRGGTGVLTAGGRAGGGKGPGWSAQGGHTAQALDGAASCSGGPARAQRDGTVRQQCQCVHPHPGFSNQSPPLVSVRHALSWCTSTRAAEASGDSGIELSASDDSSEFS